MQQANDTNVKDKDRAPHQDRQENGSRIANYSSSSSSTSTMSAAEIELAELRKKVEHQDVLIHDLLTQQSLSGSISCGTSRQGGGGSKVVDAEDDDEDSRCGNAESNALLPRSPPQQQQRSSNGMNGRGSWQSCKRSGDLGSIGVDVGFLTDAEKEDARLALMMQDMELAMSNAREGAGEEPLDEFYLEDPIWGKLTMPPGVRPSPLQMCLFSFVPCCMGDTWEWSRELSCKCVGGRRRIWRVPVIHPSKLSSIRSLFSLWSVNLALVQISVMIMMIHWDGGGFAPRSVNPMLGPWPTTLMAFGAKNSTMIVHSWQLWRLLTPMVLHAGWIHLGVNVLIQMKIAALLEKEWGWRKWLITFMVSGTWSSLMSAVFLPNTLAVGSSGALMGMMGAWFTEIVCLWGTDDSEEAHRQRSNNFMLVTVNIGITVAFSFVPYVDYAAHVGGLIMGAIMGLYFFGEQSSYPFLQRHARKLTLVLAILFYVVGFAVLFLVVNTDNTVMSSQAALCQTLTKAYNQELPCC